MEKDQNVLYCWSSWAVALGEQLRFHEWAVREKTEDTLECPKTKPFFFLKGLGR